MRRAVVTGLGLVTPLADGVEETWRRLLAGQSGADTIRQFDASHLATDYACEVRRGDGTDGTFRADKYLETKEQRKIDDFILFGLAVLFKLRGQDRILFTLGLAQAGEFGFVLVSFARQQGILSASKGELGLLVISLSMLLTPLLFFGYEQLSSRMRARTPEREPDEIDEKGRVIIAGIGRFGQVVNRLVRMSGLSTVVLDADAGTIETMRRFGVKGFFGDPTRPELLDAAGLATASVLVVAVDDAENATKIVRFARSQRPDLHIVARARDRVHVYELYQAGASDIVRETFDSSIRAGRYVLENMGFTEYEAAKLSQTYFKVDRAAMRDLAEVWVPGQPVHLNDAYIERAKQLDRDLETALIEELYEVKPMASDDDPPKASSA